MAILLAAVVAAVGCVLVGLLMGAIQGAYGSSLWYVQLAVAGVLVGALGWALVRRFAPNPAAVLRVLVPLVVVLSFVPDVVLYVEGSSAVTVIGFMVMHVVVAVPAVIAFRRVLPV